MQKNCIFTARILIPACTRITVYADCIYVFFKIKIWSSLLNVMLIVDIIARENCRCDIGLSYLRRTFQKNFNRQTILYIRRHLA